MYDRNRTFSLKPGEIFTNKTYQYLYPSLQLSDPQLYKYFERTLTVLGVTIDDATYQGDRTDQYLFFHCDPKGRYQYGTYPDERPSTIGFKRTLEVIRRNQNYITDYPQGPYHTIVVKMEFDHLVPLFMKGEYSKLYDLEQLDLVVQRVLLIDGKQKLNPVYSILSKGPEYRPIFQARLNEEFGTNIVIEEGIELDVPPILKQEILNYEHLINRESR